MGYRLNGGEYTVVCGAEGAEKKLTGYSTLTAARAAVAILLSNGLSTRALILRPSGEEGVPGFREEHLAS